MTLTADRKHACEEINILKQGEWWVMSYSDSQVDIGDGEGSVIINTMEPDAKFNFGEIIEGAKLLTSRPIQGDENDTDK